MSSSNRDPDDRKTTNKTPITPPPSNHLPKGTLSIHKWIRSIDESRYCYYTTLYSSSSQNEIITTTPSTYIQNRPVILFYLIRSYIVMIGQKKKSKSTITRSSHLDVVPRTWAEDDDDLWHPKPSNAPANGGTKATPR